MRGRGRPTQFRDRGQPRERHELDVRRRPDRLCPQWSFDAEYRRFGHAHEVRARVPAVRVLHLDEAGPVLPQRRALGVLHVQVRLVGGREHQLGALLRGRRHGRVVLVGVPELRHRRRQRGGVLRDLVPGEHGLAVRRDDLLRLVHERLVVGRRGGRRLVPADVDVRPGGDRGQFTDDVVEEPVRDRQADAQRAEAHVGTGVQRRGLAVAVEFGVRGQRRVHVPRHVDLGYDRDVAGLRVRHDVGVVRLGVEPARVAVDGRTAADRREPGPGVDDDAPALVVGQVQVEVVHLVQRDLVDVPLDLRHREEVPRDVQHGAPVGEPRVVHDVPARYRPRPGLYRRALHLRRQQLAQRLHAGEEAGRLARPDHHGGAGDVELVPLAADARIGAGEQQRDALRR